MATNAYAQAGVDVDVEAQASRIMYEASQKTYANREGRIGAIETLFDDFAGLKVFNIGGLPAGSVASMCLDGAGTKVDLPGRVGRHNTIAYDLCAMLTDDAVIKGGEPVLVGTVLDIKSLGSDERYLPIIRELAAGYVAAAREAGVSIINGEIAQMGAMISGYGDFPFNWSGACIWVAKRERLISGKDIEPGMPVVVFYEPGFRCNGLSLVRKTFEKFHGADWHDWIFPWSKDVSLGEAVLQPSTIYTRLMVSLHGGFDGEPKCRIVGAAHITGGGLPEKLGRMLRPSGCGVWLEDLFEPGKIVQFCQHFDIPDNDAYRALNMGQGMAVVTPDPSSVINEATVFGIKAQIAGMTTKEPGIRLVSKGDQRPGDTLTF